MATVYILPSLSNMNMLSPESETSEQLWQPLQSRHLTCLSRGLSVSPCSECWEIMCSEVRWWHCWLWISNIFASGGTGGAKNSSRALAYFLCFSLWRWFHHLDIHCFEFKTFLTNNGLNCRHFQAPATTTSSHFQSQAIVKPASIHFKLTSRLPREGMFTRVFRKLLNFSLDPSCSSSSPAEHCTSSW